MPPGSFEIFAPVKGASELSEFSEFHERQLDHWRHEPERSSCSTLQRLVVRTASLTFGQLEEFEEFGCAVWRSRGTRMCRDVFGIIRMNSDSAGRIGR